MAFGADPHAARKGTGLPSLLFLRYAETAHGVRTAVLHYPIRAGNIIKLKDERSVCQNHWCIVNIWKYRVISKMFSSEERGALCRVTKNGRPSRKLLLVFPAGLTKLVLGTFHDRLATVAQPRCGAFDGTGDFLGPTRSSSNRTKFILSDSPNVIESRPALASSEFSAAPNRQGPQRIETHNAAPVYWAIRRVRRAPCPPTGGRRRSKSHRRFRLCSRWRCSCRENRVR
jgi:hypothetical protein